MKNKKILVLFTLLLVMCVALCGCSNNSDETTSEEPITDSTTSTEPEVSNNQLTTESSAPKDDLAGVYVAEIADANFESAIIIRSEKTYTIMIKEANKLNFDKMLVDKYVNGELPVTISGNKCTIKDTGNSIELKAGTAESLRESRGRLDGIYENDNFYFIISTSNENVTNVYITNKLEDSSEVETLTLTNSKENELNGTSADGKTSFAITTSGNVLTLNVESPEYEWSDAKGEYKKIY